MNENLNLCQILKDCPKGTKLWSPVWGRVTFETIDAFDDLVYVLTHKGVYITLDSDGKFDADGECIIFPSKDQRDWSKFKVPVDKFKSSIDVFDPEEFKPFDKVLIKLNYECERWTCDFFSRMLSNGQVCCIGATVYECIPYNDETKHLLGTDEDAPETYKWWEE